MKRKLSLVFSILFCGIIVTPLLFFNNQVEDSMAEEKRALATIPTVIDTSGRLNENASREMEHYFSDHIGFRASLVKLANTIKVKCFGITTSSKVILGKQGWLFYDPAGTDGDPIRDYLGEASFTSDEMAEKLHILLQLQETCDQAGASFFFILASDKSSIYGDLYLPNIYRVSNMHTCADDFIDYARKNSNVHIIYPKKELLQYRESELLYYKHDTHWNKLGAYIAYRQWYQDYTGVELPALPECNREPESEKKTDLSSMLNITYREEQYERVVLDHGVPYTVIPEAYEQDFISLKSTSSIREGKTLYVIRDSYFTNMLFYVLPQFKSVTALWKGPSAEDMETIIQMKPDVVIYEVSERHFCFTD